MRNLCFANKVLNILLVMLMVSLLAINNNANAETPTKKQLDAETSLFAKDYYITYINTNSGCDKGNQNDCAILARLYLIGEIVPKDEVKAVAMIEKACSAGSDIGCTNLAGVYNAGRLKTWDGAKVVSLLSNACDHNYGRACSNLGVEYDNGKALVLNDATAVKYYTKSCDLGFPTGCSNLGVKYRKGAGIEKNIITAVKFFEKGCKMGDETGCTALGDIYYGGTELSKDILLAQQFYVNACNYGSGKSCSALVEMGKKDELADDLVADGRIIFIYGCIFDAMDLCKTAIFEMSDIVTSSDDLAALKLASDVIARGCNNDYVTPSCFNYPYYKEIGVDSIACDYGNADECIKMGEKYQTDAKYSKANKLYAADIKFYKTACARGNVDACISAFAIMKNNIYKNIEDPNVRMQYYKEAILEYSKAGCAKKITKQCEIYATYSKQ